MPILLVLSAVNIYCAKNTDTSHETGYTLSKTSLINLKIADFFLSSRRDESLNIPRQKSMSVSRVKH